MPMIACSFGRAEIGPGVRQLLYGIGRGGDIAHEILRPPSRTGSIDRRLVPERNVNH
jgi:hypothetical protein